MHRTLRSLTVFAIILTELYSNLSTIGTELKSQMLDSCNDILRTNKLEKVTKMVISNPKHPDIRPSNMARLFP